MAVQRIFQLIVTVQLLAVVFGQWAYTWPYMKDGTCNCVANMSMAESLFPTQEDCLQAFAGEDLEYCSHGHHGVVQQQCPNAVSIEEGYTNGDCASLCTRLVAGVLPIANFTDACKFEFVVPFADSVALLPDSCFSNYVYGWKDYDAYSPTQYPPLRILDDVSTPAKCQALCQLIPECTLFQWRAIPEAVSAIDGFQNPPETCILFEEAYVEGVFSHISAIFPTPFCNSREIEECAPLPWESTDHFSLFDDYKCLTCGCVPQCAWLSGSHVSGPAFCHGLSDRDVCRYQRPTWTSTSPPCEEPGTTESVDVAATAETDFVRIYKGIEWDARTQGENQEEGTSTHAALTTTETLDKVSTTAIELSTMTSIALVTAEDH